MEKREIDGKEGRNEGGKEEKRWEGMKVEKRKIDERKEGR